MALPRHALKTLRVQVGHCRGDSSSPSLALSGTGHQGALAPPHTPGPAGTAGQRSLSAVSWGSEGIWGSSPHPSSPFRTAAEIPEPEPMGQGHTQHGEPRPGPSPTMPSPGGGLGLRPWTPGHLPSSPVWKAPGTHCPSGAVQKWLCDPREGAICPSPSVTALLLTVRF